MEDQPVIQMARQVRTTAEATAPTESPETERDGAPEPAGTVFINNWTNRKLQFPDGSHYIFPKTRVTITNETLAANLREYSLIPGSQVFIESAE